MEQCNHQWRERPTHVQGATTPDGTMDLDVYQCGLCFDAYALPAGQIPPWRAADSADEGRK